MVTNNPGYRPAVLDTLNVVPDDPMAVYVGVAIICPPGIDNSVQLN